MLPLGRLWSTERKATARWIQCATGTDYHQYHSYYDCLPDILRDGLCRMTRQHIHFSIGELGNKEVVSGMRKTAEVYVHIDLNAALRDGIKFYVSENKVVLSPGEGPKGFLPAK
jgi:RNA:NAD 2'-phosphotransferase (TPT1/KptA family)